MSGPAGLPSFLHVDDRLPLVGRDRQLEGLARVAKAAAVEDRRVAVVSGPPGAGKTRLAAELAGSLHAEGWHVVGGRCRDGLTSGLEPIAAGVRQLLAAVGDDRLDALSREEVAALACLAPGVAGRTGLLATDAPEPHLVRRAVESWLHAAATIRPVALFVDDLHWSDLDTLDLLRYLASNDDVSPGLLVVLGLRREAPVPEVARLLGDLRRRPTVEWFAADPLGVEDVADLIEQVAGAAPTADAVARILAFTGGSPFFIGEVLSLLAERDGLTALDNAGTVLPLPTSAIDVVRDRLVGIGSEYRPVLEAAAVLDAPADVALLSAVADAPIVLVVDAVDAAVEANLLQEVDGGQFRFPHDLLRAAIDAELRPARRYLLHQRAAASLAAGTADGLYPVVRRARHLLAAAPLGGGPEVVDALEAAAAEATAAFAGGTAASLYERAVHLAGELGLPPSRRLRLQVVWCRARFRAGDIGAGDEFLELGRAALAADEVEVAADAAVYAQPRSGLDPSPLVDLQASALDRLPPTDRRRRALLLARIAGDPRLGPRARRRAVEAATAECPADATPPERLLFLLNLSWALESSEFVDLELAGAQERLDLARRIPDLVQEVNALRDLAVPLLTLGRFAEARRAMAMNLEAAARLGEQLPSYSAYALQCGDALYRGDFDEAADWAARADGCHADGDPVVRAVHGLVSGWLRGVEPGLVQALQAASAAFPGEAGYAMAHAVALVESGQLAEADAAVRSSVSVLDGHLSYTAPQGFLLVPFLVGEVAPAIGRADLAEAAHRWLAPHRGRAVVAAGGLLQLGAVDRVLGHIESFLDRPAEAAASLRAALEFHRSSGGLPWIARTAVDLAQLPSVDEVERRALIAEARELAQQLGLPPILARIAGAQVSVAHPVVVEPASASAWISEAHLLREGRVWSLRFEATSAHVPDSKGMALLLRLLAHPGKEVHSLDLLTDAGLAGSGAVDGGLESSDRRARDDYRRRMAELDDELERADRAGNPERAEAATREREALLAHLGAAFDRHGRPRVSSADSERARVSASRAIRTALQRIADVHPSLADHLQRTIRTGTHCSYVPDPRHAPGWVLRG